MKQQQTFLTSSEFKELTKGKKKLDKKEERIQLAFCKWVKKTYPNVIFNCDLASGLHLPVYVGAAHKTMRSSRGMPDFFASEPRGMFKGFFLELKKDASEVYCKDGVTFRKKTERDSRGIEYDHIQEQLEILKKLKTKGYWADFGLGLEDSVNKFQLYMNELSIYD